MSRVLLRPPTSEAADPSLLLTDKGSKPQATNPLAMLQIALANHTLDENGNIVLPIAANDGADKLKSSLELTNNVINHLKNVLPENAQKEGLFAQVLAKLQTRSDNLQASLSALESGTLSKDTPVEDIPMPLLIAFGLTPSEIAQVSDNIKALEEKLGRDITVEDLIAGVGNLIPQTPANTKTALLNGINETTEPTDDLAAQLNALDVGGEDDAALLQTQTKAKSASAFPSAPVMDETLDPEAGITTKVDTRASFDGDLIEGTEDIGGDVTHADAKKAAMNFKDNLAVATQAQNSAAKPAIVGSGGELLVPVSMFTSDVNAAAWEQIGLAPSSSLNLGPAAQAATMTANNAQAGQPHPATQLVAATMTKAGKEGVSDTMTLRLDPPELGSVNIRLEFGKDKMVKAHLTVEKPETYLMLQRDGLMLERALQNAGFDANSNSLSFELAQGGSDYTPNNNGQGGGENNSGGNAKAGEQTADVEQSTMTWSVDSATGHVRYNIMA